jgi:hypothetical protein
MNWIGSVGRRVNRWKNMHNYEKKVNEMRQSGQMKPRDRFDVLHDQWCLSLQDNGECNCDPEIVIISQLARSEIGRISGRKSVESGHLDRIRNLPQTKAAQSQQGRKNVESGHLRRIRNLPQTKAALGELARKRAESGYMVRISNLPQAKAAQRETGRKHVESGHIQALGRLYGRAMAENGELDRIRNLPQSKAAYREGGKIGGKIAGKTAVETGQLALIQTSDNQSKGRHMRWHANRGIVNPNCEWCHQQRRG